MVPGLEDDEIEGAVLEVVEQIDSFSVDDLGAQQWIRASKVCQSWDHQPT